MFSETVFLSVPLPIIFCILYFTVQEISFTLLKTGGDIDTAEMPLYPNSGARIRRQPGALVSRNYDYSANLHLYRRGAHFIHPFILKPDSLYDAPMV